MQFRILWIGPYQIGDGDTNDTDAHAFDSSDFRVQFIDIAGRHAVRNEHDQTFDMRSLSVTSTEHLLAYDFKAARHVRVLAKVANFVDRMQNVGLPRIVFEAKVKRTPVSWEKYSKNKE